MTDDKPKVIKKPKGDPTRSLESALDILIELYPERAERKLAKMKREGKLVVAKTQSVVV